ncbi:hypothetical protein DRF65_17520 [Chryseobacterium pennae]|uniref:Uncharacterized protein n=1 Tax=Chryseobacterium pennae TaxID=2258962 RepID=A0A3D9C5M2_9FLAO|nr:hypothetical protein DRF65_17520 [Chryseobacterium pennae]
MVFYYLLTFRPLQPALLQQKNYLPKTQGKEKQKPAEKTGQQDQAILLQDLILQVPEVKGVPITVTNCTLAQEEAVIITPEAVNNM